MVMPMVTVQLGGDPLTGGLGASCRDGSPAMRLWL
jgi:hypothetical protein